MTKAVQLLQQTLDEEKTTDTALSKLAQAAINPTSPRTPRSIILVAKGK